VQRTDFVIENSTYSQANFFATVTIAPTGKPKQYESQNGQGECYSDTADF